MKPTPDPLELDVHDLTVPLPGGTTLIEASAGTGKTYTIAAIFLRLLVVHRLGVNEILVTTFTKPATAELRDRIRQLLRDATEALGGGETKNPLLLNLRARAGADAPAEARRLREALRGFDEAAIDTIHSFCQRVLTRYAFESGAAAEPELIADERDLIHEVACDYWRRHFYDCAECHAAAARAHPLHVSQLAKLLKECLDQPAAQWRPAADAGELAAAQQELSQTMEALRATWRKSSVEVKAPFLGDNSWALRQFKHPEEIEPLFDEIDGAFTAEPAALANFETFLRFTTAKLTDGTRAKQSPPAHEFFGLCDRLDAAVKSYALAVQADFLAWAPEELRRRKERANLLSYGDLLGRLHRELHGPRGPALIARLRTQYRAALIDEFQDTDPLQDGIFERLFGQGHEGWLFLIGDPKQAIYGFRGADIFTYLQAAARASNRLTLGTNFRSVTPLVEAVNTVFDQGPRAFVESRIPFRPARAAGSGDAATFTDGTSAGPLRLWVWETQRPLPTNAPELESELAAATAGEIARLLTGPARLAGQPIIPSQIAVLTFTNAQAWQMQGRLRDLGIPSALLSTSSVFASREAGELLALLHAISRPRDEGRLRAALLTDLLGLDVTAVFELADDSRAWEVWSARFQAWHELWLKLGFIAMWRHFLGEHGVRSRLLARPDGERRLTNFSHLSELVQRSATEEQLTPLTTVKWLGQRTREKTDAEEAELRLERDDEAVRIVTIHKSKGLEYDIVFCPFAWKESSSGRKGLLRFHEDDGTPILDLRAAETSPEYPRAQREKLAEEMRLLYVALTRARHRCDAAIGRFPSAAVSASNWLLQDAVPAAVLADPTNLHQALAEHYQKIEAAAWLARVQSVAQRMPGTIALTPVPDAAGPRYVPPATKSPRQPARVFRGVIERDFSVSSFTSLTREASADQPERFAPPWLEDPERPIPVGDDIHSFPAGARTGNTLHEIFENLDFQEKGSHEDVVTTGLTAGGFDARRWSPTVLAGVRGALGTPLPPGFKLNQVPKTARLIEVEFHLPVHRLEAAMLQQLVGQVGESRLQFSPRRGWLKGYIDLVFEHGGKFYIIDWKSNRLGSSAAAYTTECVAAAMDAHHYRLQAQLYAVALHRYLAQRLPAYEYEQHFGGMMYLFVRGLDAAAPGQGVWHHRPAAREIAALDAWLHGAPITPADS